MVKTAKAKTTKVAKKAAKKTPKKTAKKVAKTAAKKAVKTPKKGPSKKAATKPRAKPPAKPRGAPTPWTTTVLPADVGLEANMELAIPRYACQKTGIHGQCLMFELNPDSGQYDILIGPTDCSHCTHIIQPVG